MMEASSALKRRRGLQASSVKQAAVQSFFIGEETGFFDIFYHIYLVGISGEVSVKFFVGLGVQ